MEEKDCKPFEHEFTYVTDKENRILCTKCWREWICNVPQNGGNEKSFNTPKDLDILYKLRNKYKHSSSLLYRKKEK